ncbi:MAG: hypothetical protein ABUK01_14995 [Leptospirales bacterium]
MPNHYKISPTAWVAAMMRADYTEIPFTKEIGKAMSRFHTPFSATILYGLLNFFIKKRPQKMLVVTTAEGRYLSTESALPADGNFVLLELGAGLSPRGLNHAANKTLVIESDLPEVMSYKEPLLDAIYSDINKSGKRPSNHILMNIDVLQREDLSAAGEIYKKQGKKKPLYIVNEGVSVYFTNEEKDIFRDNIAWFLQTYAPGRGVWLCTDLIPFEEKAQSGPIRMISKLLEKFTKRKIEHFKSHEDTRNYLAKSNLKGVPVSSKGLIAQLTCLEKMGLTADDVKGVSDQYVPYRVESSKR